MTSDERSGRRVPVRRPLNLAELVQAGLIEMTEVRIADADAVIAVEMELLEQLAALEASAAQPEVRQRLLGYAVEAGTGDLHDFVERRLVTEYLLATGVDAEVTPMTRQAPLYSHVARDATLVAIAGDLAPEAIVERLTSCPRVLLFGPDASGVELRGTLFRRVAPANAAAWPGRTRWARQGSRAEVPEDLLALLHLLERDGAIAKPEPTGPARSNRTPSETTRRRRRHIPLTGDEHAP